MAGQRTVGKQPRGELPASGERPLPQEAGRSAAYPGQRRQQPRRPREQLRRLRRCWAARAPGSRRRPPPPAGVGSSTAGREQPCRARLTALPGSGARPPLLPSPAARAGAAPRRRRLPVPEEEEPEPRSQRDKVDSGKFTAGGKRRAGSKGEGLSRPAGRSRAPRGGGRSGGSARGGCSASFALRWAPPPRRRSEAC